MWWKTLQNLSWSVRPTPQLNRYQLLFVYLWGLFWSSNISLKRPGSPHTDCSLIWNMKPGGRAAVRAPPPIWTFQTSKTAHKHQLFLSFRCTTRCWSASRSWRIESCRRLAPEQQPTNQRSRPIIKIWSFHPAEQKSFLLSRWQVLLCDWLKHNSSSENRKFSK